MVDFVPAEKSVTIRQPSTANLMIDSNDKNSALSLTPFEFTINKPNSILNGFFTRIGVTEAVLDWCIPNISADNGNNTISVDISGVGGNTYNNTLTLTLTDSFYTVKQAIDEIIILLNAQSGTTGATFSFSLGNSISTNSIDCSGAVFEFNDTVLAEQLDLPIDNGLDIEQFIGTCPDIRNYRYIDFVSSQLTYNQSLKDSSTNTNVRDVLLRWYFAEDVQEEVDAYGYPILMGYRAFNRRRLYNPPKQIRWDSQQPIGQLSFIVYDEQGEPLGSPAGYLDTSWLMTLQVSEV